MLLCRRLFLDIRNCAANCPAFTLSEVVLPECQCVFTVEAHRNNLHVSILRERGRDPHEMLHCGRVPEECPQAIADLYLDCISFDAKQRPSAAQMVQTIQQAMVAIPGATGS